MRRQVDIDPSLGAFSSLATKKRQGPAAAAESPLPYPAQLPVCGAYRDSRESLRRQCRASRSSPTFRRAPATSPHPLEPVVERGPVEAQRLGGGLDVAGPVEVRLERLDQLIVGAVAQERDQPWMQRVVVEVSGNRASVR